MIPRVTVTSKRQSGKKVFHKDSNLFCQSYEIFRDEKVVIFGAICKKKPFK